MFYIGKNCKAHRTEFVYALYKHFIIINDPTCYAQLLRERRKTAMTHTQSFVGEGFGEKYSEW